MAKNRDGSIDIYGSLQAKTEDGFIGYTDGIVHENEDGTKTPLDQLLKDSGGVIDVDKLPKTGWQGTAVPTDGVTVVKNLYFNTNLSIEETIAEIDKIDNWITAEGEHYILFFSDTSGLAIVRHEGLYVISTLDSNLLFVSDGSFFEVEWSGWNPNITYPLEINSASNSEFEGLSVGKENEKITALFSTTPFVYSDEKPKENVIYRLKEENKNIVEYKGTVVSNSGALEKLYFNTSLTNDEVLNILNNLTWTNASALGQSGFEFYPMLAYMNGSYPYALAFKKYTANIDSHSTGDINIAVVNFVNMETIEFFYGHYNGGWQTFDNPYNINTANLLPELSGISLGTQNDKLSSLISTTPFEMEYGNKYTYWVYKNKWAQLLTSEDGALGPSLVNAVETLEIDFNLNYTISDDGTRKAMFSSEDAKRAYTFLSEYVNNKDIEISAKIFNMEVNGGDADEWLSDAQVRYQNILRTVPYFVFVWSSIDKENNYDYYLIQIIHNPNDNTSSMGIVTRTPNGNNIQGKLILTKKKVQLLDVEVEQKDDYIVVEKLLNNSNDFLELNNISFTDSEFEKMKNNEKVILKLSYSNDGFQDGDITRYLIKQQDWAVPEEFDIILFEGTAAAFNVASQAFIVRKEDNKIITQTFVLNSINESTITNFYISNDPNNKGLVLEYKDKIGDSLSFTVPIDQTPTQNSSNPVASGAVYEALQNVGGGGGSTIVDVDVLPEEPNSDVIYRIQSTDTYKEGTLLVSNPQTTVNTIYFNTDLSILKTDEILSSLTYTNFNGVNVNVLYTNANATSVVFAFKSSKGNRYYIAYTTNIADTSTAELIFSSSDGWHKTEKYINSSGVSNLMGLPIGNENDKLTQVLSMNNDFVIKNYHNYWVYKNKWLQLIQNYTLEEEKGLKIIHLGDVELNEFSYDYIYAGNLSINRNLFDKIVYDFNKVILTANLKRIDGDLTEVYPTCFYPSNPEGRSFIAGSNTLSDRNYTFSSCNKLVTKSFDGSSRNTSDLLMFTAVAQYDGGNDECFITFSLSRIKEFSDGNFSNYIEDYGIDFKYGDRKIFNIPYDNAPTQNSKNLVSSGGVFEALQNIGGGSDEVTIIDVSTITETYEERKYLDLSNNGNYLLINFPTDDTGVYITLGYVKNTNVGKFIHHNSGVSFDSGEYGMSGIEAWCILYKATSNMGVIVNDVSCTIYRGGEF